jgi:hypothetical protein
MSTFKKRMLVAAVIAGLAVIGSLMNSQQSTVRAAGGPTVTIDQAQLPLPVQGSLGISGTVAATQSGIWNVGITGTPNVHVTNPVAAPALTLDISKSASGHVQLTCDNLPTGSTCGGNMLSPYVVPAGQNLVVTSVDIITQGVSSGGNAFFEIHLGLTGLGEWTIPFDGVTHSFQYPSGIVFPAGFRFAEPSVSIELSIKSAVLLGYLTPI